MFRISMLLVFIFCYVGAAPVPHEKITLQLHWLDQFEFAGFYMAKEKGIYAKAGLNVKIKPFVKGTDIPRDVAEGKSTYGIGNSALIIERTKGCPIVLLGAVLQSSPRAIAVNGSSDINTINDLKGKRLMLTDDFNNDALIMAMLNSRGLSKNDFVTLPQSYAPGDLIDGSVDAMMVYTSNQPFAFSTQGMQTRLFVPKDYGFDFYADLLYTSEEELKKHPERAYAFYEASMQGWRYAFDHIDEAVDMIYERYNAQHKSKAALKFEAEELKKLSGVGTETFGKLDIQRLETMDSIFRLMGMKNSSIDMKSFVHKETAFKKARVELSAQEKAYLAQKHEIRICVDPNWEPFETIDAKGVHQGIAADLIRLIAERTGIQLKLVKTANWEESLLMSKAKQCELMSFLNQTPQRDTWLLFSDVLFNDPNVLITRTEHAYATSLDALNNETFALPKGTMVAERIRHDRPSFEMRFAKNEEDAINMVAEGRADLTMQSLIVSAHTIRKDGLFNLKIAGQFNDYDNLFRVGILKEEPLLRGIINKGIESLTDTDKEQIINKHTALIIQKESDGKLLRATLLTLGALLGLIALVFLWNFLLRKKVKKEIAKNIDLTRRYYEQAKQAEVGSMIANISHQWRESLSKLSSINLNILVDLRMKKKIALPHLEKLCVQTEDTIDFMSQTMQNFLHFYKPSQSVSSFSVRDSLYAALSIIETKIIDHSVTVVFSGDQDQTVKGIRNEWMQVWINLINNAVAAFSARKIANPQITIEIAENTIRICDNGGGLQVSFQDNGGLGLPMCRDILKKYDAKMLLDNIDQGLCVSIVTSEHATPPQSIDFH